MGDDRVYLLNYPTDGRPAVVEDIGHILRVVGLVLSGEGGASVAVIIPSEQAGRKAVAYDGGEFANVEILDVKYPTPEEWTGIIRYSDDPVWFEKHHDAKICHRKALRQLSGMTQQKIWARDGFQCVYCGKMMGHIQLTIDHWIPLEAGGVDTSDNLVSACRADNKWKGNMDPKDFCERRGYDYARISEYVNNIK